MANEGIEVEVYPFNDPFNKRDSLPFRVEPTALAEIGGGNGGSTVKLSINDPKILADPTLLDSRNILKTRVDGVVVAAALVGKQVLTTIAEGEHAGEYNAIGSEGLKVWFDDADVKPLGGLKQNSASTRSFSFASERGDWYIDANWIAPHIVAGVKSAPWVDQPDKWPDAPSASWIWGTSYVGSAPIGSCYFRYEFTTVDDSSYNIYAAGDDYFSIYVDGARLMTSDPRYSASAEVVKITTALTAGDHVLAIRGDNASGAAGVIASLFKLSGDIETPVTYTGDSGWVTNPYPATAPGWSPGELLITLLAEAEDRGVLMAGYMTPTFTTLVDSYGNVWGDPLDWTFNIGESLRSIVTKLEELGYDIWINPDTYDLNMAFNRGIDRTTFVTDVDGISVLSTPVIFKKGYNLQKAESTIVGKIKNSLTVKTAEGWMLDSNTDTTSSGIYGTLEGQLETGASIAVSKALTEVVFQHKATPEEGASYQIIVRDGDPIPMVDYHEGDRVLAPNARGEEVSRQIMSLSVGESTNGRPNYTIEFDTIFQSNEQKINKYLNKTGGNLNVTFGNAGVSDDPFGGPIIITPTTPGTKIPAAPDNLDATSVGRWSANGVTPYTEVNLTWDPVTEATDGSAMIPQFYETQAKPFGASDDGYMIYSLVTTNESTMSPFDPDSVWTFRTRAQSESGRFSAFSDEFNFSMVGPTDPLDAPDIPTLSSSKGVLITHWNGKLAGNEPEPQFRYVYAEISPHGAGIWVQAGAALQRGGGDIVVPGLTIDDDYDVRLFAVDGAGIASAASSIAHTVITGIDLGDLDSSIADAIDAAQYAADQAATTTGLLMDTSFERLEDDIWPVQTDVTKVATTPRTGARSLRIKARTADYIATKHSLIIPVEEGQHYLYTGWVRAEGAGATVEGGIQLSVIYGSTEATITTPAPIVPSPLGLASTYVPIQGIWVVPSGAKFAQFTITSTDHTNTDVYLVDDVNVYKQIPTQELVDGAITAPKIGAGEVIAGKLAAGSVATANLQAGSVTAVVLAADSVTANSIKAGEITGNKISAGTIEAIHLAAGVGGALDISANAYIQFVVGLINGTQSDTDNNADLLALMQTYYKFGADGAVISRPGSPFAVAIRAGRIEMLENGNVVSYWTSGTMYVTQAVVEDIIVGNHQIKKYGTGTVVKRV